MSDTPYVYKWVHLPTMMWYIGSRTAKGCHVLDGYICSSKYVRPLILENKLEWQREIIATGTKVEMRILESELLSAADAKNDPRSFNRNNVKFVEDKTSSEGKIRVYKDTVNMFIDPNELVVYEKQGWTVGFSEQVRKVMKENHADVSGNNNPMFGVHRIGHTLGYTHSAATIELLRKPKTEQHRKNLSLSKSGDNHPMFGKTRTKKLCKYCNRMIADNTYARWHGDNCKERS